jgi:hypothetical protein
MTWWAVLTGPALCCNWPPATVIRGLDTPPTRPLRSSVTGTPTDPPDLDSHRSAARHFVDLRSLRYLYRKIFSEGRLSTTPDHARYVGYARCSTDTQEHHRPTPTAGRAGCEIASEETEVLEIIGRLDTAAVLIDTSSHMPAIWRPASRAKSGGIVGFDLASFAVASALPAILWPGAGSNRRPSDFQFQVHLIGVRLLGILCAVVTAERHQKHPEDWSYWTVCGTPRHWTLRRLVHAAIIACTQGCVGREATIVVERMTTAPMNTGTGYLLLTWWYGGGTGRRLRHRRGCSAGG